MTLRSPGGHVDGVVGVYTLSRADGMIAMRRTAGGEASYGIVVEQPKVGAELPDPQAQITTLTLADITAARLRDEERRAAKT